MIDTVLFDMGGTLEDIYVDDASKEASAREVLRILREKGIPVSMDVPEAVQELAEGWDRYAAYRGPTNRELKPEEIQQIAGRAGRYGMYDKGYVGATQNLGAIRQGLNTVVPPLQQAVAGFSDLVLMVDFDLLEVLDVWNRMPTVVPYQKLDISRYLNLIGKIREAGFHLTR